MTDTSPAPQSRKQRLHSLLLRQLESSLDPRELRQPGEDTLHEMTEEGAAFIEHRLPGDIKVRVSTPSGRRAGCTVIEVLIADQPFLVDTFRLALERLGLRELLLLHPLLAIERDDDGSVARSGREDVADTRESYVYAEVAGTCDAERLERIRAELTGVLGDVSHVVSDHLAMLRQLRQHIGEVGDLTEVIDGGAERTQNLGSFLEWLADDSFVFFGYRRYRASREDERWVVSLDQTSGLGIMRDAESSRFCERASGDQVPSLVRMRLADERIVFFDKSRVESRIHRHGRLDSISIKTLDHDGRVTGFCRFVGLLTHTAIRTRPSAIPLLRHRRELVLRTLDLEPGSHTYKAASEAYDSLPIEFLFPSSIEDATRAVRCILMSAEHRQVEVLVVPDPLNRSFFVSVILPRRLYEEDQRVDIDALLLESYGASYVDHRTSFLDEEVALIHFFCSSPHDVDIEQLTRIEKDIQARVSSWDERFEQELLASYDCDRARALRERYREALPAEYRQVTQPAEAALDVESMERLEQGGVELRLERRDSHKDEEHYRLKLYQHERPYLTDLLPVLDHLGLRAIDASLTPVQGGSLDCWIVTFRLEDLCVGDAQRREAEARLLEGLRAVFGGRVEDDTLNQLMLSVGLDWRHVDVLRAYLAYSSQLGNGPGRSFAGEVLARYPEATRALAELFEIRFDPELCENRTSEQARVLADLERERGAIGTSAEDRVFEGLSTLIRATTRHSFFRDDDAGGLHELSFKIDGSRVADMPKPRPFAEIFVHSAEMLGVHLRGGRVARGGLRWSDRLHDLRSEILGLMKTQMVKNGLIVPVGSKGGFALKHSYADAASARAHAERIYERFTRALLRLSDNSVGGEIVPPARVVRHDGDDPYLVVAADKGTAHLSDVANSVSEDLGFWLGDAFASGGTHGYDHKKEGITAWGAWVCARRHFLEMDIDIEKDEFTVAGIGDMSGDVFGNGLLFARRGKLQAAFNHMHVFLDPDPDPETAWRERKRLFELPRSSWLDYDAKLISSGGGVFERSARSIPLSPPVLEMLGVSQESMSGEELVCAILAMPVDLLWNGGIGTYVKASTESHGDVGDRANESVRINAAQLRARVVGEGGNLGFTQLARVEYACGGGRINTDAIDNSGGVDLSDHEVNFKILVSQRCREGRTSVDERNEALASVIKQADADVLKHNLWQSRSLSMDQVRSWQDPERMALASDFLTEHADLDIKLEFLPDREAMRMRATQARARAGYTRPELAILLGYTKMLAQRALIASGVPDRPSLGAVFQGYFPERLRELFPEDIEAHPLRREITATCLTNHVIDRAGVTLVPELVRSLSVGVADVLSAYQLADAILGAEQLRDRIEELEIPENLRLRSWLRLEEALRLATTVCLVLQRRGLLTRDNVGEWTERTGELRSLVPGCLARTDAARLECKASALAKRGLDAKLAQDIESLPGVVRCFEAVSLSMLGPHELRSTVDLFAHVGEVTRIDWLLEHVGNVNRVDGWTRMCTEALYLEMLEAQRRLTADLLAGGDRAAFELSVASSLRQIEDTVAQIEAEGSALAPLVVLSQQIRRLC